MSTVTERGQHVSDGLPATSGQRTRVDPASKRPEARTSTPDADVSTERGADDAARRRDLGIRHKGDPR